MKAVSPPGVKKEKVPLDLVAVVDHSGSMDGDKIALLKVQISLLANHLYRKPSCFWLNNFLKKTV